MLPHTVATPNEDVTNIKHDDLSVSPTFSLIKCETEVSPVFIHF
jgi:hypothetical protein